MSINRVHVVPNCRYGHGDLALVLPEKDKDGVALLWGYAATRKLGLGFEGDLYVCPSCGYTEFFDNDPTVTIFNNQIIENENGSS